MILSKEDKIRIKLILLSANALFGTGNKRGSGCGPENVL